MTEDIYTEITDKYPDCFRTHEECMKCQNFGASCIEKINDLDYQYYLIDLYLQRY